MLVVAGDVETGGAVEVDSKVWLLHVNTVITWTGSQLSQEFLGVAGGGQLPTIRVLTVCSAGRGSQGELLSSLLLFRADEFQPLLLFLL